MPKQKICNYEIKKLLIIENKEPCEICSNESWQIYHNEGCPKWDVAKENFDKILELYKSMIGQPGVNTTLAIAMTFDPLLKRYNSGERSKELYDAMVSVE